MNIKSMILLIGLMVLHSADLFAKGSFVGSYQLSPPDGYKELAALLVEKYGYGMAKSAQIIGIDSPIIKEVDSLIVTIDSEAIANRDRRWKARPAGISINSKG